MGSSLAQCAQGAESMFPAIASTWRFYRLFTCKKLTGTLCFRGAWRAWCRGFGGGCAEVLSALEAPQNLCTL